MPLGKGNFGEQFFCGSFSRKMDSESIAEARLQKRSFFSVLLEKGLDFKPGEHAV